MSLTKVATSLVRRAAKSTLLESSAVSGRQLFPGMQLSSRANSPKLLKVVRPTFVHAKASSAAMSAESQFVPAAHCQPCSSEYREEMIDFMCKLFVTREPLMRALGADPTNARKYISYCIDEALAQNASFLAIDEATGKMCGLRVNAIGPSDGNELHQDFGPQLNALPQFLHYMENDMPEVLKTERYMRHVAICVEPSVAQCGIATDLMKMSVDLAKKEGMLGMTAMCSWKLPYKLATKMGFTKVREIPYDVYAKDQLLLSRKQAQAFDELASTEGAARMMVKALN